MSRTLDNTASDSQFVPVDQLAADHRFFDYQATVNAGGVPSEMVIQRHREEFGEEYRFATDGDHPIPSLKESGTAEGTDYFRTIERHMENA
jgi:hypothetical protein